MRVDRGCATLYTLFSPRDLEFRPSSLGFHFGELRRRKKKGLHKAGLGDEGREDHVVTLGLPPIS